MNKQLTNALKDTLIIQVIKRKEVLLVAGHHGHELVEVDSAAAIFVDLVHDLDRFIRKNNCRSITKTVQLTKQKFLGVVFMSKDVL